NSRTVDAYLVRSSAKNARNLGNAANPTANGERDEQALSGSASQIEGGLACLHAGGDVEEHNLVRALLLVKRGKLPWISHIAKGSELHALHHAAAGHVQT